MAFRNTRPRSGPKRSTSWLEIAPTGVTLTAGGGTITHSLTTAEKAKLPFTIVRTYLHLRIISDQLAAAESQFLAVSGAVVSQQAEAVGVSAIPTPLNELASDYFFIHGFISSSFGFLTAVGFDGREGASKDFESKAMRKVHEDEDVVFAVEIDTGISGGVVVAIAGRMLIKEH